MRRVMQTPMIFILTACIFLPRASAQVQTSTGGRSGGSAGASQPRPTSSSGFSRSYELAAAQSVGQDSGNILIPAAGADPNAMTTLAADLLVMCRIFDKTVTRNNPVDMYGGGIYGDMYGAELSVMPWLNRNRTLNRFLNPDLRETKALYIQGYGAVFTISVRFPLKPDIEPATETAEPEPADPLWAETRQEIFEPQRTRDNSNAPTYNAQWVGELKRQVKEALRYASNIHGMTPDEYVTVVIRGTEATSGTFDPTFASLTLRVRKEDADALAAGTLNTLGFENKIDTIDF